MLDKVRFWVDRAAVGRDCSTIAENLDNANVTENIGTGDWVINGGFHGLKVTIFPHGVSIVGSLPKMLHGGSNIYPVNRHDVKAAICTIEDGLQIPMGNAKVTGLEVGANLFLKHEPQRYIDRLGAMPYKNRIQVARAAISYRGAGKQRVNEIVFYDKIEDARSKGMDIPKGFENANLLRYENKYLRRVSNQLRWEVRASSLYSPDFMRHVANRWRDSYFLISKNQINKTDMSDIKNPTDAVNAFMAHLISRSGGSVVEDYMRALAANNVFSTREQYRRTRAKLNKIMAWGGGNAHDELLTELDDEIKNAVANL